MSRKGNWIPPYQVRGRLRQARNDIQYPAACGGVVYCQQLHPKRRYGNRPGKNAQAFKGRGTEDEV
jgi:hypothetical protein